MSEQSYWKILGQVSPGDVPTLIYLVPTGVMATVRTLCMCNPTAGVIKASLWAVPSGATLAATHRLVGEQSVNANSSLWLGDDILLAAGDALWVQSDTAGIGFSAFGWEMFVDIRI